MRGASLPRRSWYGIAGAALLIASGAIHLDLYLTGYNSIPTIGPLFLLQIISAFLLAVAIPLTGLRLAYAAGAAFALGVLGGYLLSLKVGLFGFTEVRTTAGIVAAIIDVAAFAVLGAGTVSGLGIGRRALPLVGAVSAIALALTIAFVASPKTPPPVAAGGGSGQNLDARRIDRILDSEHGRWLSFSFDRLRQFGYRFDTGPSLLTLPSVFADLFAATGDTR